MNAARFGEAEPYPGAFAENAGVLHELQRIVNSFSDYE